MERQLANNHISVDCVVIGYDGEQLKLLLVNRDSNGDYGQDFRTHKLPGSLIYRDEDLDQAAARVLGELTGLDDGVELMQFRAYGSKDRTSDPRDVNWLERAQSARVDRIITIAYVAVVKISRSMTLGERAQWVGIDAIPPLAFDHNVIAADAMRLLQARVAHTPVQLFDLLPRKFTASQFRTLYSLFVGKEIDARNFHKKMLAMPYLVALDERQQGVAHRAARYYRFDRKIYNRNRR